jgi:hypothetical protein
MGGHGPLEHVVTSTSSVKGPVARASTNNVSTAVLGGHLSLDAVATGCTALSSSSAAGPTSHSARIQLAVDDPRDRGPHQGHRR